MLVFYFVVELYSYTVKCLNVVTFSQNIELKLADLGDWDISVSERAMVLKDSFSLDINASDKRVVRKN